jgi:hypothetical protein
LVGPTNELSEKSDTVRPDGMVRMNIYIDVYDFSETGQKLWNLENYPHGEAYFELAYGAFMDGDINLAIEYFSKTIEALQNGHALTVVNGQKPLDEDYDCSKRALLRVVP